MKFKEKINKKRTSEKHKGVVLNQPIESEKNDWIGVSTYVDNLATAIDGGARTIAVTSDFGSGKSSLISLYKKRYGTKTVAVHIRPKYVYAINMWETIDENSSKKQISVTDLHKSFLFHIINQLSSSKGSYISKRLSKNYGLFSLESSSFIKNFLLGILVFAFAIGEGLRRFKEELERMLLLSPTNIQIIMYLSYIIGLMCGLIILFRSDFIFSSSKSEGNRELDKNVLIDYYNHEVLYKKFWRHYIFVIEDLDRIDDKNLVKDFLKEIRNYYLTDRNRRSKIHNNRVTFVVNIKPEALLKNMDSIKTSNMKNLVTIEEKLYNKYFDYILNLRQINIDNYDSILNGLLNEIQDELYRLKLLIKGNDISIGNIPGMQWIIRGNNLGIRDIKNRLNSTLALFENLIKKFPNNSITFERCAIATYIMTEYENDFYKVRDRDFEFIVEKFVSGKLSKDFNDIGNNWVDLSENFKKDLWGLVKNKLIDSNYRIYFYNFPKSSYLYNLSETIIFNSIIYDERPKNINEYKFNLYQTNSKVIDDAFRKVQQLNMIFPDFIIEFENLFIIAVNNYSEKVLEMIETLLLDSSNFSKIEMWIEYIISYKIHFDKRDKFLLNFATLLNNNIVDKDLIVSIRKKICNLRPEDILLFKCLFFSNNYFISKEEIFAIKKIDIILQLINYSKGYFSYDECLEIHNIIMNNTLNKQEYLIFYLNLIEIIGISKVFNIIKDFCVKFDYLPDEIRDVLISMIMKNYLEANKYIDIICNLSNLDNETIHSIVKIGWINGLPLWICEKVFEQEEYLFYICNMLEGNESKLDLESNIIRQTIIDNLTWIYERKKAGYLKLRKLVLNNDKIIPAYRSLFERKYPKLIIDELNLINDYRNAILILRQNDIEIEEADNIATYFSKKHRNQTESYEILQFVCELTKEVAERLFFALNIKNISYRTMSSNRRNEINSKLINLFDIEAHSESKINFMKYVGMSINILEKDLYEDLNNDNSLTNEYVKYANSLDKIDPAVIKNLIHLNKIHIYSDKVNEKLFEMKYYPQYISSKTAGKGKFEVEFNRKNELWQTYRDMFNSSNYTRTKEYMGENGEFIELLIKDKAYLDSGEQLKSYTVAMQNKELMKYVAASMNEKDMCDYFSKIKGFASYDDAKYYVEEILENKILIENQAVYDNTHNKLVDPALKARYTKQRNKLLKV